MKVTKCSRVRNPNPMPNLFDWADGQPRLTLPKLPIHSDRVFAMARRYRMPPRIAAVYAESEMQA